jgi:flagellar basal body-associated protein FliL
MEQQLKIIIQMILVVLILLGGCFSNQQDSGFKQLHQGKISGYDFDEFKLQLVKNDKLSANINTDKLDVIIYSPINITLENQTAIDITSTGEYVIRVLMPRAFARRNEVYQYRLSLAVVRN